MTGTTVRPAPILLRQKEAAALLSVSVNYLRKSDAPRVLLPSNEPGAAPLLRYDYAKLLEWARAHDALKVNG